MNQIISKINLVNLSFAIGNCDRNCYTDYRQTKNYRKSTMQAQTAKTQIRFTHTVAQSATRNQRWYAEVNPLDKNNPPTVVKTYVDGMLSTITGFDSEGEQIFNWGFSKRSSGKMNNGLSVTRKPSNVLEYENLLEVD